MHTYPAHPQSDQHPTARSQVRHQYDQLAASYDQQWQAYLVKTLTFLQTWANLAADARVLDVACGTGLFEQRVLADHPTQPMVGIDLSGNMLELARQKCQPFPQVTFQVARALALPFADQTFDMVVSASAFHYFDDPVRALAEMKRVLKPQGTVIILDWCKDFWACRLCDLLLSQLDPAYRQCYTQSEFHHFFAAAGLTVQRARRIRFGLVWGLMVATAVR